jgi:hypothetical protein
MPAPLPRMRLALLFLLALDLPPRGAAAQARGRLPRVLELPASTRAMALGGAYMMNAGHADALFYHPALVDDASGFGLDLQAWSGEATSATASAAMAWLGGGVAVGLQTLQYGGAVTGSTPLPPGQDVLFDPAAPVTSERVASVGYARRIFGFRVGAAAKLVEQRQNGDRDATGAVDVGLARNLGPLVVGLTAANLGPDLSLPGGSTPLPTRITLGAGAYGRQVGPLDMGLAGALTRRDDGELLAGAGLEVGYWPIVGRTFVARIGVQRVPEGDASPLTLGFAYWGDDLVVEWAWRDFGALGESTHRFGIRWR